MIARTLTSSCMSMRFVTVSASAAPTPTPALLTRTSSRPQRSRCAATIRWTSASSAMLPATSSTSKPASRSRVTASASFSGRRAATVSPWPSSPSMRAIARPMPLDAPVTRAARSGMVRGPFGRLPGGAESKQPYDRPVPLAIVVLLALVLGALAVAFEGGEEGPASPLRPASVARIAERVERERGLRFDHVPRPAAVTSGEARREGLESLDADYPPARRRADAEVLALLGLVPPGTDLGEAVASTLSEAVAGYYDPRTRRLRIVEGAQTANRVLYEMVLAHELTHALEDQRFGFDLDVLAGGDDRALARSALIEGTATALMYRYAQDRFGAEELIAGLASSALAGTGDLPPFLTAQLLFSYTAGERFVARLLEHGGGGWGVVDAALRSLPPESTEQVLHPETYTRFERPRRVALRGPLAALGRGWRPALRSTFGEWRTQKLLARAGGTGSAAAAAGWGGDRFALLERGDERALVMRWTWDSARDRAEFARALRSWGAGGLPDSAPAGRDAWRTPRGAAALAVRGAAVTLAL